MRPGVDILAAFALAASAHIGLAYWLGAPGGAPGPGEEGSRAATVTPAAAAALVAGWKAPPDAADAAARLRPPDTAFPATPTLQREADRGPAPKRPASPARPPDPAALPDVPAPLPAMKAMDAPVPPLREPVDVPMRSAVDAFGDTAPLRRPAAAPHTIVPDRRAETPDPAPSEMLARRPEEATARPRPRPAQAQMAAAEASAPAKPAVSHAPEGTGGTGLSAAETRKLQAAWAGAIKARIARNQRHPGPKHGAGRVRLVLLVSRSGKLSDVRIAASSGSPGLDRAALAAVRAAAPFPKAPDALPDDWMRFGQWVEFRPR